MTHSVFMSTRPSLAEILDASLAGKGQRKRGLRKWRRRFFCAFRFAPIDAQKHQFEIFRSSLTRTALPCERGTSPGDLITVLQVTPISDLM
jgi:hypothetical protein